MKKKLVMIMSVVAIVVCMAMPAFAGASLSLRSCYVSTSYQGSTRCDKAYVSGSGVNGTAKVTIGLKCRDGVTRGKNTVYYYKNQLATRNSGYVESSVTNGNVFLQVH